MQSALHQAGAWAGPCTGNCETVTVNSLLLHFMINSYVLFLNSSVRYVISLRIMPSLSNLNPLDSRTGHTREPALTHAYALPAQTNTHAKSTQAHTTNTQVATHPPPTDHLSHLSHTPPSHSSRRWRTHFLLDGRGSPGRPTHTRVTTAWFNVLCCFAASLSHSFRVTRAPLSHACAYVRAPPSPNRAHPSPNRANPSPNRAPPRPNRAHPRPLQAAPDAARSRRLVVTLYQTTTRSIPGNSFEKSSVA